MKKLKTLISNCFVAILGGFLGAYGGADQTSKNWRRIGIPLLLTILAYLILQSYYCITIMIMCAMLSLGYGIPDPTDEGSHLGRFFYNLFKGNHLRADIFTRGTIGLLVSLTLIPIPILKHNWILYLICSLGIIIVYALISWRNLGVTKLLGKELLLSDIYTYSTLTLLATILIRY